jgi:cardiolipin synthase
MQLWRAAAALVLLAAGCASLPELHPWNRTTAEGRAPTLVTARRTLSPERSAAVLAKLGKGSDALARHAAIEEELSGAPLTLGNSADLLEDGPAFYRALFAAIAAARDHINLEFYIVEDDEVGHKFAEALLQKAAQGVAVNLMYDSVGSLESDPAFFERLRAGGVRVVEYNPVNPLKARGAWRVNNRNHRKVVIVDGRVAFTGGINVSDVYSRGSSPSSRRAFAGSGSGSGSASGAARSVGWRDTNVRLEGPVVPQLQRIFLESWAAQNGPELPQQAWYPQPARSGEHPVRIVASGPGDAAPAIYLSFLSAVAHAEKTVHVTMAYFVPDEQTIEAIKAAAARGVEVTLLLPSYTDFWAVFHAGRSHYSDLLAAGVRIHERQEALLHAKTIVIDGVWSSVGSSNLDWRSFLHNEELNAVILGWGFGKQMEAAFERDLARSTPVDREAWERRPPSVRAKEWAARIWEYWL